jgi:cytochrome c-type biogenesis protein CcmH
VKLRWVGLGVVVVVLLVAGSVGGQTAPTAADRVLALTQTIRCPQCAGQPVAESDVAVSRQIRRDIAERVEAGQADEEIRAYYASSFGPDALLTPPATGVGSLVWILPVLAVILGGVGLVLAFRRWGQAAERTVSDAARDRVAAALADRRPGGDVTGDAGGDVDAPRGGGGGAGTGDGS